MSDQASQDPPRVGEFWSAITTLILRVSGEREAALPKAISWLLRESLKGSPKDVEAFLESNQDRLPAVAVRETRNKLQAC